MHILSVMEYQGQGQGRNSQDQGQWQSSQGEGHIFLNQGHDEQTK